MDDQHELRRMALFGLLMTHAMGNLSVRLLRRLEAMPGFADQLEAMAAEILQDIRNAVPVGFTADDEVDAVTEAEREFETSMQSFVAHIRRVYG